MEDATNPSSSGPDYQAKRDAVAAQRVPPGGDDPVIDVQPEPPVQAELEPQPVPVEVETTPIEPQAYPVASEPVMNDTAPADALPGDAASTPTIPVVEEPTDEPPVAAGPVVVASTGPTGGTFTLWMLIYVLVWTGAMYFTLNHPFTRRFDWNTAYFSISARNIVRDGFMTLRGGLYPTAGEGFDHEHRIFYPGHPPLTAWILAGWMKLFGANDAAIRSLPLAFTAFNLVLLFALVRRIFGAGAGLATTVIASLLPMTAVYSGIVNMEPFQMTFLLIAALGYLSWAKSSSKLGLLILFIAVIGGCWTDWPMYIFAGLLAVAHFLQRRDLLAVEGPRKLVLTAAGPSTGGAPQTTVTRIDDDEEEEEALPARPILSSLALIIMPLAVFAVFYAYLKYNGSDIRELFGRAQDEMVNTAASRPATAPATTTAATLVPASPHRVLLDTLIHPRSLYEWLVKLFTAPAMLLAGLGALFWATWSRRLSFTSGEVARRAGFRIFLCLILMQLIYTGVFATGATRHEFWQYYLIVPVAALAGSFLTWLTVAGGVGRKFRCGLFDRAGWAVAAAIPVLAFGVIRFKMQLDVPFNPKPVIDRSALELAETIAKHTHPRDLILTDLSFIGDLHQGGLGFVVPWYADRAIFPNYGPEYPDTHSLAGIRNIVAKNPGKRIIYFWGEEGPADLLQQFKTAGYKKFPLGNETAWLIQEAGATTPTTQPPAVTPTVQTPPKTQPTTKPSTGPITRPATRP